MFKASSDTAAARSNAEGKASAEERAEPRRRVRDPSPAEVFAAAHGAGAKLRYANLDKTDADSE